MPSVNTITASSYETTKDGKKVLLVPANGACRATCTSVKWELVKDPSEPLAFDIEFQEYKGPDAEKWAHRIGRIAVVNTRGEVVLDTFTQYDFDRNVKTKMPPPQFGVTRKDLWLRNGAKEWWVVEENLYKLFHDRMIIGHWTRLDRIAVGEAVWGEEHTNGSMFYDTQNSYGRVKLCTLAADHLPGMTFSFHDPTDDARVAMLLYLRKNPFKGRNSFEDAPLGGKDKYDEDFPAL